MESIQKKNKLTLIVDIDGVIIKSKKAIPRAK
jgi:ribonucleotide monophosphatase NagD (HAD superfamily)